MLLRTLCYSARLFSDRESLHKQPRDRELPSSLVSEEQV